jgi:hypothetical protein
MKMTISTMPRRNIRGFCTMQCQSVYIFFFNSHYICIIRCGVFHVESRFLLVKFYLISLMLTWYLLLLFFVLFEQAYFKSYGLGLGSQKGKSEKGESKKAIAFLVRPVAFLAVAFLFFGL